MADSHEAKFKTNQTNLDLFRSALAKTITEGEQL